MGDKGIYKVKSNDTLSTIAQANGMITKDLLKLNTWLVDEGRVKFIQDKVLIESNILDLNETDHVLVGDRDADNILIDSNGGDDTLKGGNKKDILQGGSGYDTYHANNNDIIFDSDHKGKVLFNDILLTGGVYNKDKQAYISEDGLIEYRLDTERLVVNKDSSVLTINNYNQQNKSLGIKLYDSEVNVLVSNKLSHWGIESSKTLGFIISLD